MLDLDPTDRIRVGFLSGDESIFSIHDSDRSHPKVSIDRSRSQKGDPSAVDTLTSIQKQIWNATKPTLQNPCLFPFPVFPFYFGIKFL